MTRIKGNHRKTSKSTKNAKRRRESKRATATAPPSSPPLPQEEDPLEKALQQAEDWIRGEGKGESYKTVCRLFHIPDTYSERLRKRVKRKGHTQRNMRGTFNVHSGNNKVLQPWEEEAIIQYCREQSKPGSWGASFSMVFETIGYLLS